MDLTKNWKSTLVSPDMTIGDLITRLNDTALQICLVVDEKDVLIGSVTDGDVRRAILARIDISAPVSEIMNTQPRSIGPDESRDKLLTWMAHEQIHQMPVVDDNGAVIDLITIDDLIAARTPNPNWIVLMAGGLGTRLRPLTESAPKPLLPVGNKPILETILESFASQNFKNFFVSVNYKAEMIKSHFEDGSSWGVNIRYVEEKDRLGTAGSLSLLPERPKEPLIAMNGDLLTRVNFEQLLAFHDEHEAIATMCIREYDFQVPFGVVQVEGVDVKSIDEKPVHRFFVNAGIYVLDPEVLDHIDEGEALDMPDLFARLIDKGLPTAAFPIREYWMDIGQIDDFNRANSDYTREFGE